MNILGKNAVFVGDKDSVNIIYLIVLFTCII